MENTEIQVQHGLLYLMTKIHIQQVVLQLIQIILLLFGLEPEKMSGEDTLLTAMEYTNQIMEVKLEKYGFKKRTEHISKIIVHPENSNIVWVAAQGPLWKKVDKVFIKQ